MIDALKGVRDRLDAVIPALIAKGQSIYAGQQQAQSTLPVWVALLVAVPMVFYDVSFMNVMTILGAGFYVLFTVVGKEGGDPLSPVDKWRVYAPLAILAVPSILSIGEVDGFWLSAVGWVSIAFATGFALVASHRIVKLQDKSFTGLLVVLHPLGALLYGVCIPVLMFAELAENWVIRHWRVSLVVGAWAAGLVTIWFPLRADDFITIAFGLVSVIFAAQEFKGRAGGTLSQDQWAVYSAAGFAVGMGVLCPGDMTVSTLKLVWGVAVSVISFVLLDYCLSKTQVAEGRCVGGNEDVE